MNTGCVRHSLLVALLCLLPTAAVDNLLAADWYWVNDFGGAWDEEFLGVPSWRTSADQAGLPSVLDDALLVLPYSLSFCNPDGGCFTQPVVVWYRSETDPRLDELILESENVLLQQEGMGIGLEQLRLSSNIEIVGGSGRSFSPPPSFTLADPPGIFPAASHLQSAGVNTVSDHLVLGGTSGSVGRYELSGTGVLEVGGFEIVGDYGQGEFTQAGGEHTVASLIVGQRIGGNGYFDLEDGRLESAVGIVGAAGDGAIRQSGGEFVTDGLLLGRENSSNGSYTLDAGSLTAASLVVGDQGHGEYYQNGGVAVIASLLQFGNEEDSVGLGGLFGGSVSVGNLLSMGQHGQASFLQTGSDSEVTSFLMSMGGDRTSVASYNLRGGALNVTTSLNLGPAFLYDLADPSAQVVFLQAGGVLTAKDIFMGAPHLSAFPTSYDLQDGTLNATTLEIKGHSAFTQTGGICNVAEYFQLGTLYELGLYGRYELQSGRLNLGNPLDTSAEARIWDEFLQTGASSEAFFYGNVEISSDGRYHLTNGSLHIARMLSLGQLYPGYVMMENGDAYVDQLRIVHGAYEMAGGHLVVGQTLAVDAGAYPGVEAVFHQTGGMVDVRGDLAIAQNARESLVTLAGTGELNIDGVLSVASERGRFNLFGGRLVTSSLTNRGDFQWIGGECVTAGILNEGAFTIDLAGSPLIMTGVVSNHGRFHFKSSLEMRVAVFENYGTVKFYDGVDVTFDGPFVTSGGVESDPAVVTFADDLVVLDQGYVTASFGDHFVVEGDFLNRSQQTLLWNTADAVLTLAGSGSRTVELAGADRGAVATGRINNFFWDTLQILAGVSVVLEDGNPDNDGAALYMGVLDIEDRTQVDFATQTLSPFSGDASIYYDARRPENAYLRGLTFRFAEGAGELVAFVPEPESAVSVFLGIGLLLVARRKPQNRKRFSAARKTARRQLASSTDSALRH